MTNLVITNSATAGIVIFGPVFCEDTLTATAAETWPAGAVLARVTTTEKLVRYDVTLDNGGQFPLAVLTVPVTFDAAGDQTERPAIGGQLRRQDLVDAAGAPLSQLAIDQLRGFTLVALGTYQTSELDNQ